MQTVLVTGGAGFIGHHLVRELINQNYIVYIVDDYSNNVIQPESYFQDILNRNVICQMLPYYKIADDPTNPKLIIINQDFAHEKILDLTGGI